MTRTKSTYLTLLAVLLSPMATNAAPVPISETLPDYSSPGSISGFPIDLGDIGTFTFDVGDMLAATISGSWGNSDYSFSSAGADVYLDGLLVAQCIEFADCWQDDTGTQFWAYTFSAADLASGILDDGMAVLSVIQTSSFSVRLGGLTLEGEVSTTPVPEPGTLALLGLGLVGMAARRRKTV